jgi:glyoxylase-like metal-dependent hydrolase (beta-lactamase superfamily II)
MDSSGAYLPSPQFHRGEQMTQPNELSIDVFISAPETFHVTSTLVRGGDSAILVDAQLTLSQGRRLADWIAERTPRLSAIVITHQHPDHYLGAPAVLERFPGTPVYATEQVAKNIADSQGLYSGWTDLFAGDVATEPVLPTALGAPSLTLAGNELRLVRFPQGDCAEETVVHIPSLRTAIAGDLVYNGTHVGTAETNSAQRAEWRAGLDALAALDVDTIIAGHKAPGRPDTAAAQLSFTRQYLRDFDAALAESSDVDTLVGRVTAAYSDLAAPMVLQFGAYSQFPQRGAQ